MLGTGLGLLVVRREHRPCGLVLLAPATAPVTGHASHLLFRILRTGFRAGSRIHSQGNVRLRALEGKRVRCPQCCHQKILAPDRPLRPPRPRLGRGNALTRTPSRLPLLRPRMPGVRMPSPLGIAYGPVPELWPRPNLPLGASSTPEGCRPSGVTPAPTWVNSPGT
jgi:hypothetical protein